MKNIKLIIYSLLMLFVTCFKAEAKKYKNISLTENGSVVEIDRNYIFNDNQVIHIPAGKFRSPPDITAKNVTFIGAGEDKTTLTSEYDTAFIRSKGGSAIFRNLTLINPYITAETTDSILFVNVTVKIKFSAKVNRKDPVINLARHNIVFYLSTFPGLYDADEWIAKKKKLGWVQDSSIIYSRYLKSGKLLPLMLTSPHYIDEFWTKESFPKEFLTAQNMKIMNDDINRIEILKNKYTYYDFKNLKLTLKWFRENVLEKSELPNDTNSIDPNIYLTKAEESRSKKNYFLELYFLSKAYSAKNGKQDQALEKLLANNRKILSQKYGCQVAMSNVSSAKNEIKEDLSAGVKDMYRRALSHTVKIVEALGSSDSQCFFEVLKIEDSHVSEKSDTKVTEIVQTWVNDPDALRQKAALEQAARDAAWDASKSKFTNSLDRLSSVTKQLHENRNKIESKSDGLYLVMPGKQIKGPSIATIQAQNKKDEVVRSAVSASNSAGVNQIKGHQIYKMNYFVKWEDEVQYGLRLTLDNEQRLHEFPIAKQKKSMECYVQKDKTESKLTDFKTDSCHGGRSINFGIGFRNMYIINYMGLATQSFVTEIIYKKFINEMNEKNKTNRPEDKLDALILANLMSDKSDDSKLKELSQQVLNEPIALNEIRDLIYYYKK